MSVAYRAPESDPVASAAVAAEAAARAAADSSEAAARAAADAGKQDAATAATDTELAGEATARDAAIATHAGLKRSVHGFPATVGAEQGLVGDGAGGWMTAPVVNPVTVLPAASGSDDVATLNAILAAGGHFRGRAGFSYRLSGPLVVPSNTTLDMTGCTLAFLNTSVRTNMLQNAAVAPMATATDVTTATGSSVVASPTLAAVAQVGQQLAVVGAGPPGGDGGGAIWLYGTVLSVAGNNITLTGNAGGVAAHTTGSSRTGYLFNRDKNIVILGGRWDGGTNWNLLADRQTFNSHQLRLRRIDGLTVKGLTVALSGFPQGGGWVFGVNPGDCTDYLIEDITGDGASAAVQGDGPLARGMVRNIRGKTMDDMVAFGTVGFQGNDLEGDITDLEVAGIESAGSLRGFKLFGGLGSNSVKRVGKASLRSVKGSAVNEGVWVGDYVGATPLVLQVDDITISPGAGKETLSNQGSLSTIVRPASDSFRAADSGLKLASFDPLHATSTFTPGSNFIYMAQLKVPHTITVANLLMIVSVAGATLTSGQSLAGIYDSDGNLWAATADQSTVWTSTGAKVMALTAQGGRSLTLPGGPGVFYWAAVISNGTTKPTFAASPTTPAGANLTANVGLGGGSYAAAVPGAKHRAAYENAGARTSLVSLSGLTLNDNGFKQMLWFGCT
jgi:hypothetical protein